MSYPRTARRRRAFFLVPAAAAVVTAASLLAPAAGAFAATATPATSATSSTSSSIASFTSFVAYASAPGEIIGKTTGGFKLLTAAQAAQVPASSVTVYANSQWLRVGATGPIYKVQFETVTPETVAQWTSAGTPTPRIVDRTPAVEYYTYASAPSELMVRTPVGTWRHATAAETASVPASSITRRTNTYYLQNVGSTQILKQINGVATPISTTQWQTEGSPTPMTPALPTVGTNLFTKAAPYVDPTAPSVAAAAALRASGDSADAALIDKISAHTGTKWLGSSLGIDKVAAATSSYVGASVAAGQTGTLVVYGIPGRDCGSYSAGGFSSTDYPKWIAQIAAGIAHRPVAVVLEPDALLQLGKCASVQGDRTGMLKSAAQVLTAAGAQVYMDAATANDGVATSVMAQRLIDSGVLGIRGFAVNVSNYKTNTDVEAYAEQLSTLLGGAHYVIDTSRNGNGSNGEWCNVRGRAIGSVPAASTSGHEDAKLWIKTIGTSDGTCNGGPAAGTWWNDIALELVKNATTLG